jgi:hypothetical protein
MLAFTRISILALAIAATPAVAQTASSSAYGVSADLQVGSAVSVGVGPVATAAGSGPPPYDQTTTVLSVNQNLALGTVAATTFSQRINTGVLTSTASSDFPLDPAATASATINNLSAGLSSKLPLLPSLSLLGISADTVKSTSTITTTGGLNATGSTIIEGLSLDGLGLGGLLVNGSLFVNPTANTVLVDLLGLRIVLNEQIVTGDGISSLEIETNAIRATFTDFLLGGRLLNGDLVFASSQASIKGYMPAAPAVPEPSTWAMLIAGFGMIGFAARRRAAPVNVLA